MRISLVVFFLIACTSFGQTLYIPEREVRKEIATNLWEELKNKTPEKSLAMMEYLIKSDEIFQLYEGTMAKHGIKPYEIAVVAGFVEDVCNEVLSGSSITDAQSIENVNKMKAHYIANKIDTELSNTQKQQKYDALVLKAIWMGSIHEFTNKNSAVSKEMAKELLKTYGTSGFAGANAEVISIAQVPKLDSTSRNSSNTSGSKNTNLKEVIMITTTSYGLGGMYVSNDVYALFANGECLYEPSEPLETMHISDSKRTNPKHWDTWEMKNNIFYITDSQNGKVSDWENWFKVRPAKNGFVLNGTFKTSDPFTGGSIINSSIVYFDAQGRFEWKTTKGGLGGWKPVLVNKNSSGTYQIQDRTITLNYGNGTSEALFFGLYPKDDVHFIVGSSHFLPVRK